MNGITTDSTKLLKEKLAIARELASMKPELEHLRTQASFQESVLSDKLSLERQISTLEVELEAARRALKHATQNNNNVKREEELQRQLDEAQVDLKRVQREAEKAIRNLHKELEAEEKTTKRAEQKSSTSLEKEIELQQQLEEAQKATRDLRKELDTEQSSSKRAAQRSNGSVEKQAELQLQLEEVQKELAREKRDADRSRKDAEKELKASEARETVIESKLDQARAKLRATKEQLKDCQLELVQAQATATKSGPAMVSKGNKKRTACEMSTDETIGTPDGIAARGKRPSIRKGRPDPTAFGEKSMFSITPYLNRTVNLATTSPCEDLENGEDRDVSSVDNEATPTGSALLEPPVNIGVSSPTVIQQASKKRSVKTALVDDQVFAESKPSAKNRKPTQRKPRNVSTLEKVTEEVDENEEEQEPKDVEVPKISSQPRKKQPKPTPQIVERDDGDQKKKKRKLLGANKTLFDEEDGGETQKRVGKINLGPARLVGKGSLSSRKTGLKPGLAAPSAFAAFSPLKKDRRGVGASFLG